jgi:hypothetical protein
MARAAGGEADGHVLTRSPNCLTVTQWPFAPTSSRAATLHYVVPTSEILC